LYLQTRIDHFKLHCLKFLVDQLTTGSNELPRGKPRGIKISVLSFLSQQAAGN
jgi:hypothetical protein